MQGLPVLGDLPRGCPMDAYAAYRLFSLGKRGLRVIKRFVEVYRNGDRPQGRPAAPSRAGVERFYMVKDCKKGLSFPSFFLCIEYRNQRKK
jgi:hypothetical protein